MSDRLHTIIATAVLVVWVGVVARNAWTDGAYKIPSEVHAALMALIAALYTVPLLERAMGRRQSRKEKADATDFDSDAGDHSGSD